MFQERIEEVILEYLGPKIEPWEAAVLAGKIIKEVLGMLNE